jgi:signal peptidase I
MFRLLRFVLVVSNGFASPFVVDSHSCEEEEKKWSLVFVNKLESFYLTLKLINKKLNSSSPLPLFSSS